ncbi:MAG: hypothetical protein VXW87_02275 [Pseudomonadota bacterium]|nr:hypothetical protein [Pseudomonadota bacterium]
MITFFLEGLEELTTTAKSTKKAITSHIQKHFPNHMLSKRLYLFTMISYGVMILFTPYLLSSMLSLPVLLVSLLTLSATACAQTVMKSAIFWGKQLPRLKNHLPDTNHALRDNLIVLYAFRVLSFIPFFSIPMLALVALPILTTQIYVATNLVRRLFSRPQLTIPESVDPAENLLYSFASFSALRSTLCFFGINQPNPDQPNHLSP